MTNTNQTNTSNGTIQQHNCPVCTTSNEPTAVHCTTCAWYFPLKDTPHYALELSRAKQQFQMVHTFNQVLQNMQVQSKVLEKISFRLDGLENEVTGIKANKPQRVVIPQQYDYPKLAPIQKATDFDTSEKRLDWWNKLETQWQKAFNNAILQQAENYQPTDEQLEYILISPTIRLVGPRGMYPNMDFELTNLSGVRHLTELTILVCSHQALTNLEGIEYLTKTQSIFVNSNKLKNIKEVHYLPQLTGLYINANQITDLHPIEHLTNLKTLYCNYNQLTNLEGITTAHAEHLKEFYCLPNDKLSPKELNFIETELEIKCRKG